MFFTCCCTVQSRSMHPPMSLHVHSCSCKLRGRRVTFGPLQPCRQLGEWHSQWEKVSPPADSDGPPSAAMDSVTNDADAVHEVSLEFISETSPDRGHDNIHGLDHHDNTHEPDHHDNFHDPDQQVVPDRDHPDHKKTDCSGAGGSSLPQNADFRRQTHTQ